MTQHLRAEAASAEADASQAAVLGRQRTAAAAVAAFVLLLALTALVWRSVKLGLRAKREVEGALLKANDQLTRDAARQLMQVALKDPFAIAASEQGTEEVVRRAVREVAPGSRAELLLADNSRAHLTRAMTEPADDVPSCGVGTPGDCMAVRSGRTEIFTRVDDLRTCPKLVGRGVEVGHAICAPVAFLGQGLGVLHLVRPPVTPLPRTPP